MSSVSRRDFATQMTAAATGAIAATFAATAAAVDPMSQPADKPAQPPELAPPPALSYEDHQLAVLKELYPAPHLTVEMYEGIRSGLNHNRSLAERIREVPLTHDVPPAYQFPVPV